MMWTMGPGWADGAWGWAWMLGGLLSMIIFWGAIILLVVWAVRSLSAPRTPPPTSTPLEIARRRYAAGEITKEQFEQLRRDLGG